MFHFTDEHIDCTVCGVVLYDVTYVFCSRVMF